MTSPIMHHPDGATLMSFAAGSLPEALAALVAAHTSACPACRRELRKLERFGSALFDLADLSAATSPVKAPPMPAEPPVRLAPTATSLHDAMPEPIRSRYGLTMDAVPWRRLGPGIWHHRLALSPGAVGDLRLLKIAAGRRVPEHGHGGMELTLVLDGAFSDETGRYGRGDIQDVDDDVEHRPVADGDCGCICLVASEQPARFKGIVSRMLQPLTGM